MAFSGQSNGAEMILVTGLVHESARMIMAARRDFQKDKLRQSPRDKNAKSV